MAIVKAPNWRGKSSSSPSVASLEKTNQNYRNRLTNAGYDATTPKVKLTPLQRLSDFASRFDYAAANWSQRMLDNVKGVVRPGASVGERLSSAGRLAFDPQLGREFWQGLTGKKKGDFKQVAANAGFSTQAFKDRGGVVGKTLGKVPVLKNWSPAGSVGLAASVLNPADPLNYIGIGQADDITKLGSKALREGAEEAIQQAPKWGVKLGGKVVAELPGAQKALLKAGRYVREGMPVVSDAVQTLGPIFSNSFRPRGVDEGEWAEWMGALGKYMDSTGYATQSAIKNTVNRLVGKNPMKPKFDLDERELILAGIENPRLLQDATQEVIDAARLERRLLKAGAREEMQRGLLGTIRKQYAPHVLGTGKRISSLGRTDLPLKPREGFAKQRTLAGTVAEINEQAGREVFDPDSLTAFATREVSRQRAMKTQDFIDRVLDSLGQTVKKSDPVTEGMGRYTKKLGKREIVYELPAEIAERLNRFTQIPQAVDPGMATLKNAYGQLLNIWKGYATAANPGFHVRNALSNKYNRWLGDGFNLTDDARAIAALRGSKGTIKLANGQTVSLDSVLRMARERGVLDRGFFGADVPEAVRDIIEEANPRSWLNLNTLNPASQKNILLRGGRRVGNAVENTDRLAMFINRLRRGADADTAAKTVDKFLFNYNDLTPAMKAARSDLFPFLTWQSKNIPLQASQLISNPAKLNRTLKVMNAAQKEFGGDETYLPDYFKRLNAVPTGMKDSQGNPLYLNPNLPFQDFNKTDIGEFVTQSLNPAIKIPLELALNRSFYFGTPIVSPGKEQTKFLGIKMPTKAAYVASGVPFFGSLNKYITKTQAGKEKGADASDLQALSWLGGVKLMPYNAAKERTSQAYSERDRLQTLIRALQDQGKMPKLSSQSSTSASRMSPAVRKMMKSWGR